MRNRPIKKYILLFVLFLIAANFMIMSDWLIVELSRQKEAGAASFVHFGTALTSAWMIYVCARMWLRRK